MKRITITDIAKRAGVSKGTVSAVINGKNTVRAETRNLVTSVMKEMNFRPKGMARNLKQKNTDKSIGLIVRDLMNPFFTSVAIGVKDYANQKGYDVFITSSENDHEREVKFSQLFSNKDIKGAIISPIVEGSSEIEHLFKLKMINYPFVLLEDVRGIQANVVSIDNVKAIKIAVQYLIDNGHTKIVHFAGDPISSHSLERIEGFRKAFSECSLSCTHEMIVTIGSIYETAFINAIQFFKNRSRDQHPTAIVCFNDQQALAVLDAAIQFDLQAPDDISITGNEDIAFARLFPVPLTTIHAPLNEFGMKAAEILIRNIESPTLLPVENLVLDANFIIRKSTKQLNS
ncbi:LacI family DNA-binding transcriptional regulator [candidate division KSB1 bacterium]|nr:LacI family DNA-binding transcriptional regulator [candidate division KSB1 bacterium]